MEKAQFLDRTKRSYAEWQTWLEKLDDEQMLQPGMSGEWSAKDVIAHITWHEREMVNLLRARKLVGSHLWELKLDDRNAIIYTENQGRELDEVRAEADQVHADLLRLLEDLPEEALNDPAYFPGMLPEWEPWRLFAENIYEHYEDHSPQVKAWLERESP